MARQLDSRGEAPKSLPQAAMEGAVDSGRVTHTKLGRVQPRPGKDHSVFRKEGYGAQSGLPFVLEEPQSAKPLSSVFRNKRSGGIAV